MIDISSIISEANNENLKTFLEEIKDIDFNSDNEESEISVKKALMNYSSLLLKKYHESLKEILSTQGIEI